MASCSKLTYVTKKDAKVALALVKSYGERNPWREEWRVYRCNACKCWHLSSKPHVRWGIPEQPST